MTEDIEKKAWKEALQYAFDQADKNPWNKNQNYRDYAIENKDKLYPNKVIYQWAINYLNENYSEIYEEEVKVNTGVGKEMNDYLASKGAKSIILNKSNENIIKFKNLLEYFVSHLEWVVSENSSNSGYSRYIKPLIDSNNFKKTGQGYAGARIQDQIKEWESYDSGEITINIQPNYGDYKTVKCYLNWKGTGINIVARWREDRIVSLYQDEFIFWEEPTRRVNLEVEFSLKELELFNNDQIGHNLISFYDSFVRTLEKRKYIDKQNELMKTVLQNKKILEYKKQIILQGPPGTGKTREAKKIAEELTGNNSKVSDLKQYFKVGQKINSTSGIASYYDVLEVHAKKITIKNEKAVENREISLETINDTISQINTGQVDKSRVNYAYESALASYIIKEVKSNDQIKLIQFHPSFTYEDFVRGIVSKPNDDGDGIVYEAENKLLADFAKKAFDNYKEANKTNVVFSKETSVFDAFIESIKDELAQNENHKYDITEAVYLFSADETRFKYKGDNWVAHSKGLNMKFSELKKIIDLGATERQDIKKMIDVEELTRQHATYFIKIVEKYYDFKKTYKESNPTQARAELKNYVLIIDEINRANLSSVLGELIYALEYRGESVESMYEVDGHELILPPNLYIIGTMNTADRSVGHIDYAIRRRFAFVDVLPKDLSEEDNISFDAELFYSVEKLFDTNLSPEFEKKDVQLGHSYFIDKSKDGGSMNIRLEYEIKPILFEYVKDGVLIGGDIKKLIDDLEPSI